MSLLRYFPSSKETSAGSNNNSIFRGEDISYLKNVIRSYHQYPLGSDVAPSIVKSEKPLQSSINHWMQSLEQFELELMEKVGSIRQKVAACLTTGSFHIQISLKLFPQSHDYSFTVEAVARRIKATPIGIYLDYLCKHQAYSALYLLKVKLPFPNAKNAKHVLNDIADNGLQLFGECFYFLASKDDQQFSYFLRLPKCHSTMTSLLDSIAAFSQLKNISLLGLRSGLLVSSVFPVTFTLSQSQPHCLKLLVVEDRYDEHGRCCTDGSGFISVALMKELPALVRSGISKTKSESSSWFQIRLLCELGIFKGTLLVLPELEGNVIVLRKSMQKVNGIKPMCPTSETLHGQTVIGSVSVSKDDLKRKSHLFVFGIVNAGSYASNFHGKLNAGVLQLLCACGVQMDNVKANLRSYFSSLVLSTSDRQHAVKILSSYVKPSPGDSFSVANVVSDLLKNNVSLDEPFVQATILKLREKEIEDLLLLRIPCYPMAQFVGIPDPYETLGSDEVCIPGADMLLGKQVVVFRYPILRSSNFGLRRVVRSEKLGQIRNLGVIFIGDLHRDIGGDFDGDKFAVIADPLVVERFIPVDMMTSECSDATSLWPFVPENQNVEDLVPLIQPTIFVAPESFEVTHDSSDTSKSAVEADHRFIHLLETDNLSRKLLWEHLFTVEADRLGIIWNTWMSIVDNEGDPNSPLSLLFAKFQDDILSSRKLPIAQRILQLQEIEQSLKSAKRILGTDMVGGVAHAFWSFNRKMTDFIRNGLESVSSSHFTVNLDRHMKLDGSEDYLAVAQSIFSRYMDTTRILRSERRGNRRLNEIFYGFNDITEAFNLNQNECDTRVKQDIQQIMETLSAAEDRLKFTSALYEASYLHAHNCQQRYRQNTKVSEEIFSSLCFVWRFLPQESLQLSRVSIDSTSIAAEIIL